MVPAHWGKVSTLRQGQPSMSCYHHPYHPSGQPYQWEITARLGEIPIAELPDWVRAQLTKPKARQTPTGDDWRFPAGRRNDRLTSIAGKLRRDGFNAEEISALLLVANRQRCDPPLPDAEVMNIATSVCRYPATEPPVRHLEGQGQDSETLGQVKANLRAIWDILANKSLTPGAKVALIGAIFDVASHSNAREANGAIKTNPTRIAERTGLSADTVSRHIGQAAALGLWHKEKG